jgi:integrase
MEISMQRQLAVAQLQLADIDWRAGAVTLRQSTSHREDVLPLLATTGRAGRLPALRAPKSGNPAVFVRRLAPRDQPISTPLYMPGSSRAEGSID